MLELVPSGVKTPITKPTISKMSYIKTILSTKFIVCNSTHKNTKFARIDFNIRFVYSLRLYNLQEIFFKKNLFFEIINNISSYFQSEIMLG